MIHFHEMRWAFLLAGAAALGCSSDATAPSSAGIPTAVQSDGGDLDAELRDRPTIPFDEAEVFFEYNSTDDDLGLQLKIDAEDWLKFNLVDPSGNRLVDFRTSGDLRELGLTELVFESAEPSPDEVLGLFAAGTYKFVARSVEGERILSYADLSHDLPPAPVFVHPLEGQHVGAEDLVIEWQPIAGIESIEVIVEDAESERAMSVTLEGDETSLEVPNAFLEEGRPYKAEILAIGENGNKTISELGFVVDE